jgi:bis(5'-nucleosyl)-tetraphosphatase (symmetrical)
MIHLKHFNSVIVHAGVNPLWQLNQALSYSDEISQALQSDDIQIILNEAFGNDPNCWQDSLTGTDRIRCLINYFTRMRFCTADGTLDFRYKGEPPHQDPNFKPWFEHALAIKETIYFGHWASLLGKTQQKNIIGLFTLKQMQL